MSTFVLDDFGLGADTLELLGRPRVIPSTPVVDPAAVAFEVFHRNFDLDDPVKTRALLESLLPETKHGSIATTPVAAISGLQPTGATPMFGKWATASAALQTLSTHATAALDRIRPLKGASMVIGCGHKATVALIRATIESIEAAFATGEPVEEGVNRAVKELKGLLDTLGTRAGIDKTKVCDADDERIYSDFQLLRGNANQFEAAWTEAKDSKDQSFAQQHRKIRRLLLSFVVSLTKLRAQVPSPVPWMAIVTDGTTADQFWRWQYEYAATIAPKTLDAGGREALAAIATHYKQLKELIDKIKTPPKAPANPPGCVKAPLRDREVKKTLADLNCLIDDIITATT